MKVCVTNHLNPQNHSSHSNHDPHDSPHGQMTRLLTCPGEQSEDAADFAYRHIVRRIERSERSVEVFMYVWRADTVGHWIGQALLAAADRGVKVRIFKDRGAVLFESQESNRKSFFKTPRGLSKRVLQRGIGWTLPDSHVSDHWDQQLGDQLLQHQNVEFHWVSPTHTKYYCIDEKYLITGSLNLEDRHRGYHDVMVEVRGEDQVHNFRVMQKAPDLDLACVGCKVVLNDPGRGQFLIKPAVLDMIGRARTSIHIEMAYLGDEDVTKALIRADQRGVKLSILFSEKSNIGNDINYHVLKRLMKNTGIKVRLSSKMIHSKVMVVDRREVLLGSANFSVFSLQRAGELCLQLEGLSVINDLNRVLGERYQLGRRVDCIQDLPHYWRTLAKLQQWHQQVSRHS